jgi:YVTN family beta-propeller protein
VLDLILNKLFRLTLKIFIILCLSLVLSSAWVLSANTQDASVVATVNVGGGPFGLAYDSAKSEVFVTNFGGYFTGGGNTVSVISDVNNAVVATVNVGNVPRVIAYDSAKGEVFVVNYGSNTVSVISDVNNAVVATVNVGANPFGIAYDPVMGELFVANSGSNTLRDL